MGARATGPAGAADPLGRQRRPAQRGHRRHRRASGRARLGARDAPLAAGAQRSRGVELLGVDFETVGAMQLYRASDALVKHREAIAAHLFDRAQPAADGDALRPDQHLLRGRGERPAAGATRALEGEAQRLPAADPGPDARCQRLRAPFEGLRRQRPRTPDAGRDARSTGGAGRRPGGDGPRCRHRRLCDLVARQRLPLSGGQPRTPPPLRCRCRRVAPDAVGPDRAHAKGGLDRPRRSASLLLLRGAGQQGARHRRAFSPPASRPP